MLFYNYVTAPKQKIVISSIVIFILIYFAGYRDGLGIDYKQYLIALDARATLSEMYFGQSEPLFNLISFLVSFTFLSPIFFFLISAMVTNIGIGRFIFENEKYAVWSLLFYLFIPTLYMQSFNIVRQFFAIGLFYYALKYVGVSLWKYLILCILATLMHMSAIVLIPLYWILQYNIKGKTLFVVIPVSMLIFSFLLNYISTLGFKYSELAITGDSRSFSGIILFFNILFLLFILQKEIFYGMKTIYRNLFIFYIVTVDFSFINYNFYRFSYFFYPVVVLIIPYTFQKLFKTKMLNVGLIILLLIMHYFTIISNPRDTIVVPNKILPVLSIFDSYYKI